MSFCGGCGTDLRVDPGATAASRAMTGSNREPLPISAPLTSTKPIDAEREVKTSPTNSRRRWGIAAALAVVALAVVLSGLFARDLIDGTGIIPAGLMPDERFELKGDFWVYQSEGTGVSHMAMREDTFYCDPEGPFADIGSGMQMTVSDETGKVLGTGTLEQGAFSIDFDAGEVGCIHHFTVSGLPRAEFYQVGGGRRGAVTYTFDELESSDWKVVMSLG